MSHANPRTLLAVAVGAIAGGTLALASTRATPPATAERPFRSAVEIARAVEQAPAPAAPSALDTPLAPLEPIADGARPSTATPDPAAIALGASLELIRKDEQSCARGAADRCLRAARFYEEGDGVSPDADRALGYLRRAVVLYAEECRERNARSCYSLSVLYERGRGVPPDQATAKALVERTRELCRANQSAFCDAADAPPAVRR